jgi:hypothetical protein
MKNFISESKRLKEFQNEEARRKQIDLFLSKQKAKEAKKQQQAAFAQQLFSSINSGLVAQLIKSNGGDKNILETLDITAASQQLNQAYQQNMKRQNLTPNELKLEEMREIIKGMNLQCLKSKESLKNIKKVISYRPSKLICGFQDPRYSDKEGN